MREIKLTIGKDGKVNVDVAGVKGSACQDLTKSIEAVWEELSPSRRSRSSINNSLPALNNALGAAEELKLSENVPAVENVPGNSNHSQWKRASLYPQG
jgi:hypothetical protein